MRPNFTQEIDLLLRTKWIHISQNDSYYTQVPPQCQFMPLNLQAGFGLQSGICNLPDIASWSGERHMFLFICSPRHTAFFFLLKIELKIICEMKGIRQRHTEKSLFCTVNGFLKEIPYQLRTVKQMVIYLGVDSQIRILC